MLRRRKRRRHDSFAEELEVTGRKETDLNAKKFKKQNDRTSGVKQAERNCFSAKSHLIKGSHLIMLKLRCFSENFMVN